jgi:hypothetical protein
MMNWLFDTSMGVPGWGGEWPPWLTVVFSLSNAISGGGLILIPFVVNASWRYRRDRIPAWEIQGLLAIFPVLGVSRMIRACYFWGPPYHLTTILDCSAAACSIYSLIRLPRLMNVVFKLPERGEIVRQNTTLSGVNVDLAAESEVLKDRNRELSRSIRDYEFEADGRRWSDDAIGSLDEIKGLIEPKPEEANGA